MRDKIIEVIKKENRKLNPKEIMDFINDKASVSELRDLIHELDLMCRDGILRVGSGNTYFFNDLITGVLDVHSKGNAHVLMKDGNDVFIPKNNMKNACDRDTVAIEITDKEKNEGKIVKILKRSLGRAVGEVINKDGHLVIKPLDELPYRVEVMDSDLNLVDGHLVRLRYLEDIDKKRVLACVDSIICHKNAPGKTSQISMIASEFNRRLDFPNEVLEEAKNIPTKLTAEEVKDGIKNGRKDLRGEVIFTIDGKDTKDIDDAISNSLLENGNYHEITAIADVSHYVKYGSAIWDYAVLKGNSDYLGNKVGPMLPVELSNGICSLNPNEDRFSLAVEYELDSVGNIINPNVFKAVIKSKKKMNYDAVQDIIEDKETEDTKDYTTLKYTVKDDETIDTIAYKFMTNKEGLLKYNKESDFVSGKEIDIPCRLVIKNNYITSKIMGDALNRRGKTDFESSEPKYTFDENDNVINVEKRVQRKAERLIENKMIYANEAFTMFMVDKLSQITTSLIPFVFRTEGEPNPRKIEEFLEMLKVYGISIPLKINPDNVTSRDIKSLLECLKDKDNYSAFSDKLLRCMQKARYTIENYGHFALASENYCHYTSPIRRMADLLVHTVYTVFCAEKNTDIETLKFWGNYISNICDHISECEIDAEKAEYAVNDYLNATYLEDKIGTQFEAVVDGLLPGGFFARTDNCIDGRVDFCLDELDSKELLKIEDPDEAMIFIEKHKKPFITQYDYNEKLYGYSRGGRMLLRYGDRILVSCIGAYPERREVDFALVRKI